MISLSLKKTGKPPLAYRGIPR